jgi:hypothetical protein
MSSISPCRAKSSVAGEVLSEEHGEEAVICRGTVAFRR